MTAPSVRQLAVLLAVTTFVLITIGGTVNPTGSSLACPDWPLCHGQFFPEMKEGVQYEHTHRLAGTAVGIIAIWLAAVAWRRRAADPGLARLAVLSLALVVVQGVLGGVTVLLKLPLATSAGHLALSMAYFLLVMYLALRADSSFLAAPRGPGRSRLMTAALVAVYVQILLGALVRHTKSGLVCANDWLLCKGELWPEFGPGQLHMLHRFAAIPVAAIVIAACAAAVRRARAEGNATARALALSGIALLLLQVALGLLSVFFLLAVVPITAHLAVGTLLLGDLFALLLLRRRAVQPGVAALRTLEAAT